MIEMNLQYFGGRSSTGSRGGGGGSKELTSMEKESLEAYTGPEGFEMNKMLRGEEPDEFYGSKEEYRGWIDGVTSAIDKQSLPNKMTLYRGATYDSLTDSVGLSAAEISKNPESIVGKTLEESHFLSATSDKQTAQAYSRGNVMYNMTMPKGAKVLNQNAFNLGLDSQEYTIQRKSKFTITGAHKVGGTLVVDITYKGAKR